MPIFIFIKDCEVKVVVNGLNTPLIVKTFKELMEGVGMINDGVSKDWTPVEPDEMRNRIVASGNGAVMSTGENNMPEETKEAE